MRKSELKSGMWVKTRNGGEYMTLRNVKTANYGNQEFCLVGDKGFLCSTGYKDNLKQKDKDDWGYDIMSVHGSGEVNSLTFTFQEGKVIWKREERTELTISEIEDKLNMKRGTLKVVGNGE